MHCSKNRKTTAAPPGGQKRNQLTPVDHMCNIKAIGQVVVERKKFNFFQKSIKQEDFVNRH